MKTIKDSFPLNDGFCMPAEYDVHDATLMIWPDRPGSWGKDNEGAIRAFTSVFKEILESESLFVIAGVNKGEAVSKSICDHTDIDSARIKVIKDGEYKREALPCFFDQADNVHQNLGMLYIIEKDTDDSWARDTGPTIVRSTGGELRAIDWAFNAWGGDFDGLYASWDKDDELASFFAEGLSMDVYDAHPFVLEGGSIHSDGEGTVMVTESCLLSKGRNPKLSKEEIEDKLKKYLGCKKVLWLPFGIYNDETNEHVDNVCAFTAPGEVVLAFTDNKDDPQYEMSLRDLEYLENVTDARGRHLKIHKLPIPDVPVTVEKEDLLNYVFEEGEDNREEGERLAASYVNFYFTNTKVLIPFFGGKNKESDLRALEILQGVCKNRKVVPIDARAILLGGGNIHCITQQIPAHISNMKRKIINFE